MILLYYCHSAKKKSSLNSPLIDEKIQKKDVDANTKTIGPRDLGYEPPKLNE